jgi:muconolactone delta-isomerase
MKILALSKRPDGVTTEQIAPHRVAEAAQAWELYTSGVFRELYFRTDKPGAVVMLECADVAEAQKALATLPMVEAGVLDFDLIPLGPFLEFRHLFKNNE